MARQHLLSLQQIARSEGNGGRESLERLLGLYGRFLTRYLGPLEADFQRFYGIDLRDAFFGPRALGLRRVVALIGGLPADSSFVRLRAFEEAEEKRAANTAGNLRHLFGGAGQIKYAP